MDFQVQQFISNLIENQFPRFYKDDGENFVLFTKAYYEWLESNGQPISQARKLLDYRDIDNTLEPFLSHFQQKYLYGIPFSIISNKRFLLKHILDVYRSKGTIQCYRLLFRLIYNEDVEIYLPGVDILKASDGIWIEPKYIELSLGNNINMDLYVGKTIIGVESLTIATIENYVRQAFNNDVVNIAYISNISPTGGDFKIGEFIVLYEDLKNISARNNAPTVLGSLNTLQILDGGTSFKTGDLLKIVDTDQTTNKRLSFGTDGLLKVSEIGFGKGALKFAIVRNGFGWLPNAEVFVCKSMYDTTGYGAKLEIRTVNATRTLRYNTNLIVDIMNTTLNQLYPFDPVRIINKDSRIVDALNFEQNKFGSIYQFSEIIGGSRYTQPADVFVRTTMSSKLLPGYIQFSKDLRKVAEIKFSGGINYTNGDIVTVTSSLASTPAKGTIETDDTGVITAVTVTDFGEGFIEEPVTLSIDTKTGTGAVFDAGLSSYIIGVPTQESKNTIFDIAFQPKSVITLIEDVGAVSNIRQNMVTRRVVNSSFMFVYSNFNFDSTDRSGYLTSPSIVSSQFASSDIPDVPGGGGTYGENELITAYPTSGNNIVSKLTALNSGKGYLSDEVVTAYPHACLSVTVENGGSGYANNDKIIFSGGSYSQLATGKISEFGPNGSIVSVRLITRGSGYQESPYVYVRTKTGSGAKFKCTIEEFDTTRSVTGKVKKAGYGVSRGFWETTKGFLDNDKYIQDSYYYQDYSYEIQTARTIDVYKPVFQDTFHPAGSEMFGKFLYKEAGASPMLLVYDDTSAKINPNTAIFLLSDSTEISSDSNFRVDRYFYYPVVVVKVSSTFITSDEEDLTSDNEVSSRLLGIENNKYTKNKKFKKETSKWLKGK